MSWMFDRLCEIAIADQVEVTLCATPAESLLRGDSPDLAEVLARAASVPQFVVTSFPSEAPAFASTGRVLRSVDLDELEVGCAVEAIGVALRQRRMMPGTALRLRGSDLELAEVGPERVVDPSPDRRRVFATDAPGRGAELRHVGRNGLGIAIGGVDPDAQVRVDTFLGVVSILDALVTLRTFAFGCDSIRPTLRSSECGQAPPPALRRVV